MRNWTTLLIIGLAVLGLLVVVFIYPYPKMEISSLLVFGGIILLMIAFGMWGLEIARKHSCHLTGFGVHTSICTENPIAHVTLDTGKEDGGSHDFHLFLANGCQGPYYIKGGKTHGSYVVRDDCLVTIPGDESNVWVFGTPEWYKAGARPGGKYKPLEYLPKEIYEMVMAHNFDPRGAVGVFWRPHQNRAKLTESAREEHYYKGLYELENQEIDSLRKQLDFINKSSTRQADAHERTLRAMAPERERTWSEGPKRIDQRRDEE